MPLGTVSRLQGDYAGAQTYFERSRRILREIGNRLGESHALANLGNIAMDLGDYARAKTSFEQALHIKREIGDPENEGVVLSSLGLLAHQLGDDGAACKYSQQALQIVQEIDDRATTGEALTHLGHALAGQGQLTAAAEAYRRGLTIRRELGKHNVAMEPLAGLTRIALAQRDLSQAKTRVAEILAYLEEESTLDGTEEPLRVYLTCYQVLQVTQDPRARDVLNTAHHLLQERAARIEDEELRRSFLENVAVHREIIAAYHESGSFQPGRQVQIRLPRTDAPTGRPLHDDEYVTVTWTVDAPGDQAIPRKTDRLRHRILLAPVPSPGPGPVRSSHLYPPGPSPGGQPAHHRA